MSLLKSEAVVYLCCEMGAADGDFSKEEMQSLIQNPEFKKYEWDSDLYSEKCKRGEVNHANAVSALKGCSLDTQIDALALVWNVLLADGVMSEGEKGAMVKLCVEFDIEIETIVNRLNTQLA